MWDESDPGADPAALYRRTWPGLIGVLTSIGGSRVEAEAVAEDAYVKLLGRWDAIRRYDDPELWVRGLAVRTMVSRLRRREALARLAGRLHGTRVDDVVGEGVADALGLMSPGQRAVVVLHDVLELPIEQIAEELQCGVGAVRSRLARARQSLAAVREAAQDA
ncbi:MAG TPA: sigma factor-like helix-turn-helix DNA-binding protein [Kribbella sp.]|nr:sigma factor-like helix-turn-helix DNA-binding protein [Kribbella sp.]